MAALLKSSALKSVAVSRGARSFAHIMVDDSRHAEEPAAKRARLADKGQGDAATPSIKDGAPVASSQRQSLRPRRLAQFLKLLTVDAISPAAVFSNRLAAQCLQGAGGPDAAEALEVFIGNGNAVHRSTIPLSPTPVIEWGKEGVLLPQRVPAAPVGSQAPVTRHQGEVQSVVLTRRSGGGAGAWLGSVDSRGHAVLHLVASGLAAAAATPAPAAADVPTVLLLPPTSEGAPVAIEPGWAGVAVSDAPLGAAEESQGPLAATAMHFARRLRFFQGPACTRTVHTVQPPTCITFLPGTGLAGAAAPVAGLLACAEEHQVSLWDVRQGERQGLVQRLPVGMAGYPLYSLAWCEAQGGLLGAAGAERTVTLLEPRKWRAVHKWQGAAKYTIHHCVYSRAVQQACYVAGLDYECVCGRWDKAGGGTTGNANSAAGHAHGRAVGPAAFVPHGKAAAAATDAVPPGDAAGAAPAAAGTTMSFRGDARWYGLCGALGAPAGRDVVLASTQAGSLFVLEASSAAAES